MNKKIFFMVSVLAVAATMLLVSAPSAQATTGRLASAVISDGYSATLGGTTNYTYTVTTSQAIPASTRFIINFWYQGPPCSPGESCSFDFISATATGIDNNIWSNGDPHPAYFSFLNTNEIAAGTFTFTINGAKNPGKTGRYASQVMIQTNPSEQVDCMNPIFLGAYAVVGRVTLPSGAGASGAGVNIRTQDFSFNYGEGTDTNGYFGIPVVTNNGTITSGTTYFLDLWPPQGTDGITPPDATSFVYSGSIVTKNLSFIVAAKSIVVTVKYDNGSVVTNANVWANKRGGGSNVGGTVNSSGMKTLSVSGGTWDVGINCPWLPPPENRPGNCDWAYNQQPYSIEFANNSATETQSLTLTVMRATAIVKGKVLLPNGTPLSGGFVDIRKDNSPGMGTGINGSDGTFQANVPAGDYTVNINVDNNNPNLARYYMNPIPVRIGDNETRDLGTLTMSQKTSSISGYVKDTNGNGIPGVRLNSNNRNGQGWSQGTSGIGGAFTIYVSPGEWEVRVDNGPQSGNYIALDNKPVSYILAENQSVADVLITVKLADASLNVKLVDANGGAISNVFGYAYARKKDGGFDMSSQFGSGINRGTATIRLIGGATYLVGCHMPPDSGVGFSLQEEVEVTVSTSETKEVKLTLVPNDATIRGYVKDQNGSLVTNLDAEVFIMDQSYQGRGTRLQPDGSFTVSVRGGKKYMVNINLRGGNGQYVMSHPKPGDEFEVPVNSTYTKVVTLMKADSEITGIVKKPDGTPMPRAWVNANNFRSLENKIKANVAGAREVDTGTESAADGTFRLPVIAGQYQIHSGMPPEFSGNYMPPEEVTVDVTPTKPAAGVVLQYRQADATAVVTVTLPDGAKPDMGFCHAWAQKGGFSGKEVMGGTSRIPLTTGTWNVGCDSFNPMTNKFYRSDERQVSVTKGIDAALTIKMEEGLFSIPKGFTSTFSATEQQQITLPDGTSVSIPSGALGSEGNITFSASPNINLFHTSDTKPINFAWDFSALDANNALVQTFNSNVTICIPYNQEYLDKVGVDENTIVAKYYNSTNGSWQLPDGVTQDFTTHTVCFSVSHFTSFALATGSSVGTAASGPAYIVATPTTGGGPQVTVWDGNGKNKLSFFAFAKTLRVGIQAVSADVNGDGKNEIIVAPGPGVAPQVRIFDTSGKVLGQFFAYATTNRTGIQLAVADVNGDGTAEIITVPMAGAGPQLRIFDYTGKVLKQFFAYASSFRGGVNLSTGDINSDGTIEIVTVPASKAAPQVRTFKYDGTVVSQFFAYATTVRGGYHVTTGDANGDGTADVIVSPEPGLGPQVAIYNGAGGLISKFFAYASSFRGGLYVSVGDVNGDGANEIVATPESAAGPQVRVLTYQGKLIKQFFAYASTLRGSFTSFVGDVDQDGSNEIIMAPGKGMGPQVRVFTYSGTAKKSFFTHAAGFRGGVTISGIPTF